MIVGHGLCLSKASHIANTHVLRCFMVYRFPVAMWSGCHPQIGEVLSAKTTSLSPCGQLASSRKKLTSKQFPGEPAGEGEDFLSWTLCPAIQNRQSQQALEIWGERAREMGPGGAGSGLQIGWKHFQADSSLKSQTIITCYWNLDFRI